MLPVSGPLCSKTLSCHSQDNVAARSAVYAYTHTYMYIYIYTYMQMYIHIPVVHQELVAVAPHVKSRRIQDWNSAKEI